MEVTAINHTQWDPFPLFVHRCRDGEVFGNGDNVVKSNGARIAAAFGPARRGRFSSARMELNP